MITDGLGFAVIENAQPKAFYKTSKKKTKNNRFYLIKVSFRDIVGLL